jgi:hypothetical protein
MVQLPARVVGYVSTQHGVAIDYDPPRERTGADVTTYEVISGSARIEELVLRHAGAPGAMFQAAPVFDISNGNRILFVGIHLTGPIRIAEDVEVVFDRCLFSWAVPGTTEWSLGTARLELYGNRRADNWSAAMAIERAKEEVLAALFELQRAELKGVSLQDYYAHYKEQTVLVLGSYSLAGMARLRRIKGKVAELGYEPVLISDVPDQEAQTLLQKVVMVGSLSRFVIVDDAEPSGHLTELVLCKANDWLTVVMRPNNVPSSAMSAAAAVLSNVILEVAYDPMTLEDVLPSALEWAEKKRTEIGSKLRAGYPFSNPPG